MKTSPIDFLLSGCILLVIITLDCLLLVLLKVLLPARLFGNYQLVVDVMLFLLIYGLLSALFFRMALKLRPLPPGDYAMEDAAFTYWKLLTVVYEFGRGALLPFTSVFVRPVVAKLFGCKTGRDIAIGGTLVDPQFIRIEDYAVLGQDSVITAHAITSGRIILREVLIARGATVGVNAIIMPGVSLGEGAVVSAGSVVTMNTKIPPAELWGGIPARKIKDLAPTDIRG